MPLPFRFQRDPRTCKPLLPAPGWPAAPSTVRNAFANAFNALAVKMDQLLLNEHEQIFTHFIMKPLPSKKTGMGKVLAVGPDRPDAAPPGHDLSAPGAAARGVRGVVCDACITVGTGDGEEKQGGHELRVEASPRR